MKFNTKKLLSVTSSLLIAAQQCFIAMPAGAVDVPSEAETYAQQIGLELNSSAAENALSDLIDINDSDLGVAVDDNNNVTQINGLLSDETVDNSNDAKDIIAKASELLGIDNVNREIRLDDVSESEYNRIYTFKQFYQGLEMINSYIKVVVDKETGEADFLNSSVVSDFSIYTTPAITAQQAIDAVVAKFGQTNVSSHKLAIYSKDNETFKLAWEIKSDLFGGTFQYVDATNGEILNDDMIMNDTAYSDTITYNNVLMSNKKRILPANQYSFTIDVSRQNNIYKLYDIYRKVRVVRDKSFIRNGSNWAQMNDSTTVKSYNDQFNSNDSDQIAVATYYNVQKTFDFYKNTFDGFMGYDGKGSTLNVISEYKDIGNTRMDNAWSYGSYIAFGEGDGKKTRSYGSALDIVAHEYTHCVTWNKVYWGNDGEAGAMNEGYSDVMGSYCEIINGCATPERKWIHGTDHIVCSYSDLPYYLQPRDGHIRETYDGTTVESHEDSKIIHGIAYWMDYLGIDATTGAKIWFNALDYLPTGYTAATFKSLRTAMVKATQKVVKNKAQSEYVLKVKTAFNRARIYDDNEIIGDILNDGQLDVFDLTLLKQAVLGNRTLTPAERAQADLNFDGKVNAADVTLLQDYLLGKITEF